jgi:hypothetical protein
LSTKLAFQAQIALLMVGRLLFNSRKTPGFWWMKFLPVFVFREEDVLSHGYDDCQVKCIFFVLGYRCAQNGRFSPYRSRHVHPSAAEGILWLLVRWSTPGYISQYSLYWTCYRTFTLSHCTITRWFFEWQCKVAATKVQLVLHQELIWSARNCNPEHCEILPTQTNSWLGSNLQLYSRDRQPGGITIRYLNQNSIFSKCFGNTSGYRVWKKRPQYKEG